LQRDAVICPALQREVVLAGRDCHDASLALTLAVTQLSAVAGFAAGTIALASKFRLARLVLDGGGAGFAADGH
jgi:hypothetical protein